MSLGALIVGSSYLLLSAVTALGGEGLTGWVWLALFFLILTFGELFILPTGLGLFARLAPPHLGATTVASWFLVIFTGSLSAGLVGTLWSRFEPSSYFLLLAAIGGTSAALLRLLSGFAEPQSMARKLSTESD
jgi:POT family proton-dependent oligopeptide transporter